MYFATQERETDAVFAAGSINKRPLSSPSPPCYVTHTREIQTTFAQFVCLICGKFEAFLSVFLSGVSPTSSNELGKDELFALFRDNGLRVVSSEKKVRE